MDFDQLLEQHNTNTTNDSKPSLLNSLNGSLSCPRDGPDTDRETRDGGFRRRGRPHPHQRREWRREEGGAREEEPGTFCYSSVWGKYLLWKDEWKTENPGSILVQFEAKGPDNIVVSLAAAPNDTKQMYEIVIGGWNDTKSVIRREAQGPDRAIKAQSRLCSRDTFLKYWAALADGVVSVGVGEIPGQNVILAWKDMNPIPAQYASFTSWDRQVRYRNIRVAESNLASMVDVDMENFQPEYLKKLEEERQRMQERAKRFGEDYVEPSMQRLAEEALTDQERAQMKQMNQGLGRGFVTGFDITSESEREKAEARAKRFGIEEKPATDPNRAKLEERARRFAIPVIEDLTMTQGVIRDLSGLRVPRRDPEPGEQPREEAIHLYGSFDGIVTTDINSWFGEYGAANIEWLHDCGANIVFADGATAKRALMGVAKEIPTVEPHTETVMELRNMGYFCAPFPLQAGGHEFRFFLIRKAAVADVKASKDSGYRSNIGYAPRRRYRIVRRMPSRGGAPSSNKDAETHEVVRPMEDEPMAGKRRGRDDDSSDEDEDWKRKRRDSFDD